jgi:hypothetical protein
VPVSFRIQQGDVRTYSTDALVLKYAQWPYGADAAVRSNLLSTGINPAEIEPTPGRACIVSTQGAISAPIVVFVGVDPLSRLDYPAIQKFGASAIRAVVENAPSARIVAMTLHGPGYGLDETESARALLIGCVDGLRASPTANIERLDWIEIDHRRIERLNTIFDAELLQLAPGAQRAGPDRWVLPTRSQSHKPNTDVQTELGGIDLHKIGQSPTCFVAMPFSTDEQEDTYFLGIQPAVHANGYLCERILEEAFLGNIDLEIFTRLNNADLVIADLTGSNANVFLELGYAWGRKKPTVLLARDGTQLPFDVRTQKCLFYKNAYRLQQLLGQEIKNLIRAGRLGGATLADVSLNE